MLSLYREAIIYVRFAVQLVPLIRGFPKTPAGRQSPHLVATSFGLQWAAA
jgi:hypothetical protein